VQGPAAAARGLRGAGDSVQPGRTQGTRQWQAGNAAVRAGQGYSEIVVAAGGKLVQQGGALLQGHHPVGGAAAGHEGVAHAAAPA
jgi:hypothetical protein